MKTFSKEAYLPVNDEAREDYPLEQFAEELREYIAKIINSPRSKVIDLSGVIFPRGFIFNFLDYLPESPEMKQHRRCEKILIAKNTVFSGNASFSNVDFLQPIDFENADFSMRAVFHGSRFHADANFSGVNFYRQCNFARSEFLLSSTPNFYHCKFHESASFTDARFHESVNVIFDYSYFQDVAFFNNVEFQGKASFIDSTFQNICNFSFAKFYEGARFSGVRFQRLARFTGIKIKGSIDFARASISENCLFNHLHFKAGGKIRFDDLGIRDSTRIVLGSIDSIEKVPRHLKDELISFEHLSVVLDEPIVLIKDCKSGSTEQPIVRFENCFFERGTIRFENCDLRHIDHFIYADQRIFDAFTFKNCDLPRQSPPHLFLPFFMELRAIDNFEERRSLRNLFWKNLTHQARLLKAKKTRYKLLKSFGESKTILARRRKEKYAFLKADAEKEGDSQLASDFFFNQMYWAKIEKETFTNSLYYSVSGYGLSWFRPLIIYILGFLIFFLIYFAIHADRILIPNNLCQSDFFSCFKYITSHAFDKFIPVPLGLTLLASSPMPVDLYVVKVLELDDKPYTGWQFVATFLAYVPQKVIQLFLLFEFGASVRNKVKR